MSVTPAPSATAEQAVVRAALARGWLTGTQLREALLLKEELVQGDDVSVHRYQAAERMLRGARRHPTALVASAAAAELQPNHPRAETLRELEGE